jgi:hypothetical protein
MSGLTYSLTETPYSAYLSMRKKFTKESSSSSSLISSSVKDENEPLDTNKSSQTKQTLDREVTNHNHTKYQLSVKEAELSKLAKQYEKIVNEASSEHINLTSSITNLTHELATEIDDHAQSEQAIRRLEEKVDTLHLDLNKQAKENKALKDALANSEQTAAHYHNLTNTINEKLCKSEFKLADAANADSGVLNARIIELEGTVTGKNRIISLLKDQATLSLRKISDLGQKLINAETSNSKNLHTITVPHPAQPDLPAHALQSDTSPHVLQVGTPVQDAPQAGSSSHLSQLGTPQLGTPQLGTPQLGTPQLGTPQLGTAVSNVRHLDSSSLTDTVEHPDTLTHKSESQKNELKKVADINDNLPPKPGSNLPTKSSPDDVASDSSSSHSGSDECTPVQITHLDPETFCNNCHNKIDDLNMELPSPIYEPNFIHECPSPWLHFGYCSACLEVARFRSSERGQGNEIIEHITHCPVLVDQCFDGEHEEYVKLYTEKQNEGALASSQSSSQQNATTDDDVELPQFHKVELSQNITDMIQHEVELSQHFTDMIHYPHSQNH